jgi:cytochrome oxidase assembly protein ShyY1
MCRFPQSPTSRHTDDHGLGHDGDPDARRRRGAQLASPIVYRFVLRPRWLALLFAVAVLVAVCVQLAQWQIHRLDDRRARNAVIVANSAAAPRPWQDVLAPGRPVGAGQEWTRVTARGRYDARHQVLVRYRPYEGEPGFHVLTPLVISPDTAVLVDRGWISSVGSAQSSAQAPSPPPAPTGQVTVTGRVRPSEPAEPGAGTPRGGQVRFIATDQIDPTLPYALTGGYVELVDQRPAPGDSPRLLADPELSEGPHLAYAIQWYLFAVIAIGGVVLLAYDEAHDGQLRSRMRAGGAAGPHRRDGADPRVTADR